VSPALSDRQSFAIANLREAYADANVVFASEHGTRLDTNNVTKRFKRALARAGLPATTRFHDLQHGTATLMREAGGWAAALREADTSAVHEVLAVLIDRSGRYAATASCNLAPSGVQVTSAV
jgi:site-specific recombinase XerC